MRFELNDSVLSIAGALAEDASVAQLLSPLMPFLSLADVTEVVLNEPRAVFVEQGGAWHRHVVEELDYEHCLSLAVAIAAYTHQDISQERPLLSATLPGGQRIQVVIPPACPPNQVSITIRLPSRLIKTLEAFEEEGLFQKVIWRSQPSYVQGNEALAELDPVDRELVDDLTHRRFCAFFDGAVRARKNIAIVGDTGSGKTTFMKTLCQSIPHEDRLVTIEDVREIFLPRHPNCVHLLYSKDGQGLANVTPASLIACTLRMRPDRVLLAELRGAEAFDFLKLLTTGHAGSLTSFHARSCALAMERFVLMAREHPQASRTEDETLGRLLYLAVDVIAHCVREGGRRYLSEVYFDPLRKLQGV
ncbi:Type IV secretion system protein VirB11 [Ralstonia psammae]|uniref:Type IV secretion system protein n=1 Tax=Ralstonia psammae TaxID=3058598 RepID=A0ABM9JZI6_9RALS|nr:P-type DNA transfer ATPase VirB11 [Ralstonia sp. LMG 19083]CAJ0809381.1 Type IV secretion system protein VirB11 [Ralstonia sp. LMG 19083]